MTTSINTLPYPSHRGRGILKKTCLPTGRFSKLELDMLMTERQQFDLLINGEIVSSSSGKYFDLINPSTGEVFARVADAASEDVQEGNCLTRVKNLTRGLGAR